MPFRKSLSSVPKNAPPSVNAASSHKPPRAKKSTKTTNTCMSTDSIFSSAPTAVEQGQARNRHQNHQCCANHDPSGVTFVGTNAGAATGAATSATTAGAAATAGAATCATAASGAATFSSAQAGVPIATALTKANKANIPFHDGLFKGVDTGFTVRIRTTCSRLYTKILPSPILPVLADFSIASIT